MTMPPPDGQRVSIEHPTTPPRSGFWRAHWPKLAAIALVLAMNPFSGFGLTGGSTTVPTNYETKVSGIGWAPDPGQRAGPGGEPTGADRAGHGDRSSPGSFIGVRILGGDASIELTVRKGAEAEVAGYQDDDQYLRFGADGVVEVNTDSAAYALNSNRYGGGSAAPSVDPARAAWKVVSQSGRYSWHDHRAHWMSASPPLGVVAWNGEGKAPDSAVAVRGTIPLTVNGQAAEIDTVTYLLRAPSAARSWFLAGGIAAIALVVGRVVGNRRWTLFALVPASFIAGWAFWVVLLLDEPQRWAPWHLALPAGAAGALAWGVSRDGPWRLVGSLAGLLLLGTGATLMPTFGAALAPGLGPEWLARVVGAASIGVGAVVVLSGTWELFSALRTGPSRLASTVTE